MASLTAVFHSRISQATAPKHESPRDVRIRPTRVRASVDAPPTYTHHTTVSIVSIFAYR